MQSDCSLTHCTRWLTSLSANNPNLITKSIMYITVPYRSSSAIQSLEVDALRGLAHVTFKNGTE